MNYTTAAELHPLTLVCPSCRNDLPTIMQRGAEFLTCLQPNEAPGEVAQQPIEVPDDEEQQLALDGPEAAGEEEALRADDGPDVASEEVASQARDGSESDREMALRLRGLASRLQTARACLEELALRGGPAAPGEGEQPAQVPTRVLQGPETPHARSLNIATHEVSLDDSVTCQTCGNEVSASKARKRYKTKDGLQRYQCCVCNCRVVQLSRSYDSWPTPEFKALDSDAKQEFMREVGLVSGPEAVFQKSKEVLAHYTNKEKRYYDGGKYLPLSVWGTQGFDTEAIKNNSAPQDKASHPVLGLVYRVAIIEVGTALTIGEGRRSECSAVTGEGPRDASSSARESSGGDGADQKDLKRRAKELEKEVKAAEKKRKLDEAAQEKSVTRHVALAEKSSPS